MFIKKSLQNDMESLETLEWRVKRGEIMRDISSICNNWLIILLTIVFLKHYLIPILLKTTFTKITILLDYRISPSINISFYSDFALSIT